MFILNILKIKILLVRICRKKGMRISKIFIYNQGRSWTRNVYCLDFCLNKSGLHSFLFLSYHVYFKTVLFWWGNKYVMFFEAWVSNIWSNFPSDWMFDLYHISTWDNNEQEILHYIIHVDSVLKFITHVLVDIVWSNLKLVANCSSE